MPVQFNLTHVLRQTPTYCANYQRVSCGASLFAVPANVCVQVPMSKFLCVLVVSVGRPAW